MCECVCVGGGGGGRYKPHSLLYYFMVIIILFSIIIHPAVKFQSRACVSWNWSGVYLYRMKMNMVILY